MFGNLRLLMLAGGLVTVLGLGIYVLQYIRSSERNTVKVEQLRDQIEIRERIDEAISNSPSNVSAAIELLQRRQDTRD